MTFLECTAEFENKIAHQLEFELLELHYIPYAFGSGMKVYRIKGKNIKIYFDGRERQIEVLISPRHERYPTVHWTSIFNGSSFDFMTTGIKEIGEMLQ